MIGRNRIYLAFAAVAAALLTGCAPSVESQLVGTWKPTSGVVPLADAELTFTSDHRFTLVVSTLLGSQTFAGDWEYLRPEGEGHLLSVRGDGMSSFQERPFQMPTPDQLDVDWNPFGTLRLVRAAER